MAKGKEQSHLLKECEEMICLSRIPHSSVWSPSFFTPEELSRIQEVSHCSLCNIFVKMGFQNAFA